MYLFPFPGTLTNNRTHKCEILTRFHRTRKQGSIRKRTLKISALVSHLHVPSFAVIFVIWHQQYWNIEGSAIRVCLTGLPPCPAHAFYSLCLLPLYPLACPQVLPLPRPPQNASDHSEFLSTLLNYDHISVFPWVRRPVSPEREMRIKWLIYNWKTSEMNFWRIMAW